MGWTVAKTGRVLRPMNGVDLARCMDAADAVDPRRGYKWIALFRLRASQLGYVFVPPKTCECKRNGLRPECGLGKLS